MPTLFAAFYYAVREAQEVSAYREPRVKLLASSEMIDCRGGLSAEQEGKKSALISSMIRPVGCNVGASPCGQENEAWHGFGCWVSITRLKKEIISNFNMERRFVSHGWHALQSIRRRRWEFAEAK